ncbi:MAG: transcription initiation factor IIB family protein [Nitrososphaerota archaeon]|nr:transcription initiation factor IIB family protein [Nitrososphaerota archaeon]
MKAESESKRESSIRGILDALDLGGPAVHEKTAEICSMAADGSSQGTASREMSAAAVYASCRLLGIPRSLKKVAVASGLRTKRVARRYRKILTDWDIKVPAQDPAAYVPDIAARVGLDAQSCMRALDILEAVKKYGLAVGKNPTGVAAAALYEAYAELHPRLHHGVKAEVTQKDIADAAGVVEVTVRNRVREMQDHGMTAHIQEVPPSE